MATGRDATDVAITTSFGTATLVDFQVVTDEVAGDDERQAPPPAQAEPEARQPAYRGVDAALLSSVG
jgi:hypothetical protein